MGRSRTRLLYLCFEGLPKTVFDSQVVGFLKAMAEQGLLFDLFVFESLRSAFGNHSWNVKRRKELEGSWGGKVFYIPFGTRCEFPVAAALFLLAVSRDLRGESRLVLHCRGYYGAFLAALLKKLSRPVFSVYDVRGDAEAEFRYRANEGKKSRGPLRSLELQLLRWAEGHALRAADQILCVSSALKGRLRERWGLEGKAIDVIPSCADSKLFHFDQRVREEVRKHLGLEGRFVLVYTGSLYRWQGMERIVEIARRLSVTFPNLHFLCLTPHLAEAGPFLAAGLPQGSYTLLHAAHVEIPRYLMAADLGLLIREDHPLNEVACPTKFGEYVMCGLPVLTTEGLGDLPEVVKREGLGIVMNHSQDFLACEGALVGFLRDTTLSDWRVRTAQIGRERFGWDRYVPRLREIYENATSA